MQKWIFLTFISIASSFPLQADETPVIGWIEQVKLMPEGFLLDAKIDTGADNSSLDAYNIEYYSRAGQERVKFKVHNNGGKSYQLDKAVKRKAKIKRKQGGLIERPVIMLDICLGQQQYQAQVNLANRQHFKYRMLIGRSFLKDRYLVNSAKKRAQKPECDFTE